MKILSVGHALPSRVVTNGELADRLVAGSRRRLGATEASASGATLRRLLTRCGASTRFHRAKGETALELGCAAATDALRRADRSPADVDLLIYAGVGRGCLEPATANVFQHALGLRAATCFDILDACAGWLRGLDVACHLLRGGRYRLAMILNCEFNFKEYAQFSLQTPEQLNQVWSGFTVGEAATATLVGLDGEEGDYHAAFASEGQHSELCQIPLPNAAEFQVSQGHHGHTPLKFYALAHKLNRVAIEGLAQLYWNDRDVSRAKHDIIFGHSAGIPATRQVARALRLNLRKHVEIFPTHGNTVSASIPLAMSLAQDAGVLSRQQRVLILVGSAGVTTAIASFTF